jgi:hypothetical protein
MVNFQFGSRKKALTPDEPLHIWKKTARERPEEILRLPLHSLLVILVEIFDELPLWALLQLHSDVLVRISRESPRIFAKVTFRDLNRPHGTSPAVSRLAPAVLASLDPAVLPSVPRLKLAGALKEEPKLSKLLSEELLQETCDIGYRAGVLSQSDIAALLKPSAVTKAPAPAESPGLDGLDWNDDSSVASKESASAAGREEPRAGAETDQEPAKALEDSELEVLRRQNTEWQEKWTRLKRERKRAWENIRTLLHAHGWRDWDSDSDKPPLEGLLIFAEQQAALAAGERERAEQLVIKYDNERTRRMVLEDEAQVLTQKLEEQSGDGKTTQDLSEHEAEVKRLQQLVDSQDKKHRAIIQSLEEQHSATVRRLINEHTAEMSDQMTVYEKELAETRMARDEQLAQQEQRHRQEVVSLKDRIASLEIRLASASHEPQSTSGDSSQQTANNLPTELPLRISFSSPADMTEFLKRFVNQRQDSAHTSHLTSTPHSTAHSAPSDTPSGKT